MSNFHIPDKELFECGVLVPFKFDEELQCELQGLYQLRNGSGLEDGETLIPCIYKKILSYKNGFTRAINIAGNLIYIRDDGEQFFDRELPFVPELCEDFDKGGTAAIACLVDGVFIVKGHMNREGEMFLKGYNS